MKTIGAKNDHGEQGAPSIAPWGWVLTGLGIILMGYAGFVYDPSVESGGGGGLLDLPSRINNNGLMQHQLLIFLSGVASFISGTIFLSAATIYDLLREFGNRSLGLTGDVDTAETKPTDSSTGDSN